MDNGDEIKTVMIVGNNSSGKTAILEQDLIKMVQMGKKCVYNRKLDDLEIIRDRWHIDKNVAEELSGVFDGINFNIISDNKVDIKIDTDFELDKVTSWMSDIMNIVLLDCDYLFLDEPESMLSRREIGVLTRCLCVISKYRCIEYTTHKTLMAGCMADEIYIIVKKGNEYVKQSIEDGDDYEYTI